MRLGPSGILLLGSTIGATTAACGDDAGSGGAGTTSTTATATTATTTTSSVTATTQSAASTSAAQSSSSGGPSGEGTFVAVGYGGRRIRSIDDGQTWTDDQKLVDNGGDDTYLLRAVGFGAGTFVAAGWRAVTSPDGVAWNDAGETGVNWIGSITYAAGKWVAVGGYGLRGTSADGITWEDHSIDTVASHGATSLAYGDVEGGRFVSTNDDGARAFATDGTDWQTSSGAEGVKTRHVSFGNGVFVGVGGADVVVSSDGGATFEQVTPLDGEVRCMTFGDGKFVALSDEIVFISTDGQTWEKRDVPGVRGTSIAFGHGTFVLLGENRFRSSTDAVIWEPAVEVGGQSLEHVTFGPM